MVSFEYIDQIFQKEEYQINFNVEVFVDLGSPPIPDNFDAGKAGNSTSNLGKTEGPTSRESLEISKDDYAQTQFTQLIGNCQIVKNDSLSMYLNQRGVKFCVYFPFPLPKSKDENLNMFPMYLHSVLKYMFLRKFTQLLTQNYNPIDAFFNAKNDAIEELNVKVLQDFQMLNVEVSNYRVGSNIIEFKDLVCILDQFVGYVYDKKHEADLSKPWEFEEGQIADLSERTSNQIGFRKHFIRRNILIMKLYGEIQKNTCVNLHGDKGIGKTTFLCHFLNELVQRNVYPDGVFYFDLKNLYRDYIEASTLESDSTSSNQPLFQKQASKNTNSTSRRSATSSTALGYSLHNLKKAVNFKDLIKGQFGSQFDHNMKEYFQNKKMLIIFDGFDLILKQSTSSTASSKMPMITYPTFLLKALFQFKIPMIFSSDLPLKLPQIDQKLSCFNLEPMNLEQSLTLLVAIPRQLFVKFSKINWPKLKNCHAIEKSKGNPRLLNTMGASFIQKTLNYSKWTERGQSQTQDQLDLEENFGPKGNIDYQKNLGSSSYPYFSNFELRDKSGIMEYSNSSITSNSNHFEDNWLDPNMMQILGNEGGANPGQGIDMRGIIEEFENDGLPTLRTKESMFEYPSTNNMDLQKELMLRKTESVRTGGTNTSKDFSNEYVKLGQNLNPRNQDNLDEDQNILEEFNPERPTLIPPKANAKDDPKFKLRDMERQKKQEKALLREAHKKKKTKIGKAKLKRLGKINRKSTLKDKKPTTDLDAESSD